HHVQVVARAIAAEAGAVAFPFGHLGQGRAHEIGQGQVLEEDLHELFLAPAEDGVVVALAGIAGIARAAALATAALRLLDAVALDILAVARVDHLARATLPVAEHRLGQITLGNGDVFALFDVADAAAVDGPLHGVSNLILVSPQEALTVADRLVLAS